MKRTFVARRVVALFAFVVLAFAGYTLVIAPETAHAAPRFSVQSGAWNDPATWGGTVPNGFEEVTISAGHVVHFPPNEDLHVDRALNTIVLGTLEMKPASPSVNHWIMIHNIEDDDVGGDTDVPVATDVGIWVMGAGKLDIVGSPKMAWQRSWGGLSAQANAIPFVFTPDWQKDDLLVVTPTEHPHVGERSYTGFEERTVTSNAGANPVTLNAGLAHAHPQVDGVQYGWPEILNLSRNVTIQGSMPTRRGHIFIRNTAPAVQNIDYAELRWMGVDRIGGRYPIHFHHSHDFNVGSRFTNVVVRDAGHHAFVTHNTNGVTYENPIAYNVEADPYWWDPPPHSECLEPTCPPSASHNVVYQGAVAAKVYCCGSGRSNIPNSSRLAGFDLSDGDGNKVINSVAVGVQADTTGGGSSGFEWPEGSGSRSAAVWQFNTGNRSHNNSDNGIFVWQNVSPVHPIENFMGYNNRMMGISHGAYSNNYHYKNSLVIHNDDSSLHLKAGSRGSGRLRFEGMTFDGANITGSTVRADDHRRTSWGNATLLLNPTFKNAVNAIHVRLFGKNDPYLLDVVCPTYVNVPNVVAFSAGVNPLRYVRVQNCEGTAATEYTPADPAGHAIPVFYPYP
jgi:hypothetical protein